MMMFAAIVILVLLIVLFLFGPRPRLDPVRPPVPVPRDLAPAELAHWLDARERAVPGLIEGTAAHIEFANPTSPAKTPLCFVYIHGFSATWPETAPVTSRLAAAFSANALQTRLAGHGTGPDAMVAPAEQWLASATEAWEIATQLGDHIVLVATSTGAPLSVWLASLPDVAERLHALLFMSPNFRIRTRFDFLLTAPWSPRWIHLVIGRYRQWQPANEGEAKFWTWRYSTLALIEMQKIVDWARRQRLGDYTVPLAIMYMKHDPTIDPAAAIAAFDAWGAAHKALIPVTVDGDEAQHVFVGDIDGPQRTDWCVDQFTRFLAGLPAR